MKRKPEKKWQRIADEDYLKWENAFFENRRLAEENQRLKTLNGVPPLAVPLSGKNERSKKG